jgi:FixJ family two-component response regulator
MSQGAIFTLLVAVPLSQRALAMTEQPTAIIELAAAHIHVPIIFITGYGDIPMSVQARFETLTLREREVMALVVTGRLNKQIAYDIGISEITVKVHRGQAMRKMNPASLPDLARMADKLNLTVEKPQSG